jgi:hypothetical protein
MEVGRNSCTSWYEKTVNESPIKLNLVLKDPYPEFEKKI